MSRGTAFDAARDGLLGGASDQIIGNGVGHLVTGRVDLIGGALDLVTGRVDLTSGALDLVWGGARDLISGGASDQLAGGGTSVWRKAP